MKVSQTGVNLIQFYEKLRLKPYFATKKEKAKNIATIGWGNTYYQDGTPVKITDKPITKEQADLLFKIILTKDCEEPLNRLVKSPLTQNQFDALSSLIYNIGITNFLTSTALRRLNAKNYLGAADAMVWFNKQDGKVMPGLVTRRQKEKDLFLS